MAEQEVTWILTEEFEIAMLILCLEDKADASTGGGVDTNPNIKED